MNDFENQLKERLESLRQQELYRELRQIDSPQSSLIEWNREKLLNFSSNDYLGLANHSALKEAAIHAIEKYGAGAGAARLVCGSLAPHHELETTLAAFKGTEAALTFSSGYAAALGTLCALLGKDDTIVIDKKIHACLVDGARLCGAKIRVFAHNDLGDLEAILEWAAGRSAKVQPQGRTLIVTESVFSMDGDHAPLAGLVALKNKYGAWLMIDEAHATGLYGANRRGRAEECGIAESTEIQMGTLGKAFGSSGGYICGSQLLIDFLINCARTFIFSTAPGPGAAAAATAGIKLTQSEEGDRRGRVLWERVAELKSKLGTESSEPRAAIIPIVLGTESRAVEAAKELREKGLFVPAIRFPTVARGSARLRVTLTAMHSLADVERLANAVRALNIPAETLST